MIKNCKLCVWIYVFILLSIALIYFMFSSMSAVAAVDISEKYFKGAKIKEIYRMRLDPGDLLLESIQEFIDRENIKDGAVVAGIGTLSECRMHWITKTTFPSVNKIETIKAPLEVSAIHGIIADGKPHLHMTVSDYEKAIAGHVEEGCRVMYLFELVIESYEGVKLTRRPNEHGTSMLQRK